MRTYHVEYVLHLYVDAVDETQAIHKAGQQLVDLDRDNTLVDELDFLLVEIDE